MRFFNWFLHAIVLLWYPTRLDVAQMTWDTCCRLRTRCDGPLSPLLTAALTVRVRRRRRAARRASAAVALAHGGARSVKSDKMPDVAGRLGGHWAWESRQHVSLNVSLASYLWCGRLASMQGDVRRGCQPTWSGPLFILGLCRWKIPPIAAFRFPCGRAVIVGRHGFALHVFVRIRIGGRTIILSGRKFLVLSEFQIKKKLRQTQEKQTDSQVAVGWLVTKTKKSLVRYSYPSKSSH